MAKELRHIPYEELAKDLAGILDRVVREHESVVVEREGTAIAVVKPMERPASRRRRRAQVDPTELLPTAFTLETAAGSVPALPEPLTWDEIEQRVKEEREERQYRNA